MKYFDWDDAKNAKLRAERGIGFEDLVFHIDREDLLEVLTAPERQSFGPASVSSSSGARTKCTWCRSWRTSTRCS